MKLVNINAQIQVPVDANEEQINEWIKFHLGCVKGMSDDNPLFAEDDFWAESVRVNHPVSENRKPKGDYFSTIECHIKDFGDNQDVSSEYLEQALEDGLTVLEAVESFYNDCSYDLSQLTPLKGKVNEFHTEVRKLTRPYIAISDEQQQRLIDGEADYYLTPGGKVVTFGYATTHGSNAQYALMPLNHEEATKVKAQN